MYMMMRVTQFSIIHLFSTEISANEWLVRKIENRIYILRKKKVAGALIVIQYLVSCWQIELNSLERFDISQAKCWIFSSWHKKKNHLISLLQPLVKFHGYKGIQECNFKQIYIYPSVLMFFLLFLSQKLIMQFTSEKCPGDKKHNSTE